MTIKRIPVRDGNGVSLREHQVRMTEVGRIRTGVFDPDGRGRPKKLATFRFTATSEEAIRAVAAKYGGTVEQFTPQRSTEAQWQVITPADDVDVYVPRQNMEPWLEAWRPGTCIRRCDGEWETIKQEACPCAAGTVPASDLCKPVIRLHVLLADVEVVGTWRLEPHGENAVSELGMLAPLIAQMTSPRIPASLMLRREQRRTWSREKEKFESLDFYVPYLMIVGATPRQMIEDGKQQAIGAVPVEPDSRPAPPVVTHQSETPSTVALSDANRAVILGKIEEATTVERLMEIANSLVTRGVKDERVKGALISKKAGILAAQEIDRQVLVDEPPVLDVEEVPDDGNDTNDADSAYQGPFDEPTPMHFDPEAEFMGLFTDVAPKGWPTAKVHDAIKTWAGVDRSQDATGAQLHQLRAAIADGRVT